MYVCLSWPNTGNEPAVGPGAFVSDGVSRELCSCTVNAVSEPSLMYEQIHQPAVERDSRRESTRRVAITDGTIFQNNGPAGEVSKLKQ